MFSVFCALGFLNEADMFKSSSILIYSHMEQSIYTLSKWHDAVIIKRGNLKGEVNLYEMQMKYLNVMRENDKN